jgi:hypothetical protein
MFGLEGTDLQLEDGVAVPADVVEEQIDVEGLSVHGQGHVTPHEGEPAAQLQREVAKVRQQPRSISRSLASAVTVRESKL